MTYVISINKLEDRRGKFYEQIEGSSMNQALERKFGEKFIKAKGEEDAEIILVKAKIVGSTIFFKELGNKNYYYKRKGGEKVEGTEGT
jgi:hypothetical protein